MGGDDFTDLGDGAPPPDPESAIIELAYGGEGDDIIPIDGGAGDDSLFGGTNLSNEGSEFDGIPGGEGDDLILRGDEPTKSATTRVANVALEAFLIEP